MVGRVELHRRAGFNGAVAFGIISLLPVELILQVGSGAGFAMVFALLIAAIIWNIGTWYFGLPASSSHTLVGSIIGVGIANQLMPGHRRNERSGLGPGDGRRKVAVVVSPGGICWRRALAMLCKALIPNKQLYEAPKGTEPPPFWIRGLLVLTCTGVSFAHGSNDGQKGMGLIMLILIGTVPTAYAVNHAVTYSADAGFRRGVDTNGGDAGALRFTCGGGGGFAGRGNELYSHARISRRTPCWPCVSW